MIFDNKYWMASFLVGFLLLVGCSPGGQETQAQSPTNAKKPEPTGAVKHVPEDTLIKPTIMPATPIEAIIPGPTETPQLKSELPISQAEVLSVDLNGEPGNYSFSVKVSSPDEGCSQYADWWEVLSLDGDLIYRRVLHHSHVAEQPFSRSGGPVPIDANTIVQIRVHMNTSGYSSLAMKGSPEQGFEPIELSADFAEDLSELPPLPGECGF